MSKQPAYHPFLDNLAEAIAADDRVNAKDCLESSFAESDSFVETWLVKAWTSDSLEEAEASIQQALLLDPGNDVALAGMNWLLGIQEFADTQLELKRCEEKRLEEEEQARLQEEARAAEEQARQEAAENARREAEEKARQEEEDQRKLDETAEKIRLEVEERRRLEAEKQAKWEAEEKARIEAEKELEKQKRIAAEEARWEEKQRAKGQAEQEANQDDDFDFLGEPEPSKADETNGSGEEEAGLLDEVQMLSDEINKTGDSSDQSESGDTSEESTTGQSDGKTVVLAVDDSPTVRKLVALTLTREGFEVLEAENGIEALNILGQQLPDIILSDINMPKLNGYKLCKFVKKHERTKNIPVVMLSGKDGVFDKMRGKLSGCDDFISKPFESAALVEKVREHLNSSVNA